MAKYNLQGSMSDRAEFDRVQEEYAEAMMNNLTEDEALFIDPDEYAEIGWDNFVIDLQNDIVEVDDEKEAKARFMSVFKAAVRDWQIARTKENLEEEFYLKESGYKSFVTVFPGGQQDGLGYGPSVVEIISLETDGKQAAYRYGDDAHDNDWQIGSLEDAATEAVDYRHQGYETEREVQEQQQILNELG